MLLDKALKGRNVKLKKEHATGANTMNANMCDYYSALSGLTIV
jgi:hypothetical protein